MNTQSSDDTVFNEETGSNKTNYRFLAFNILKAKAKVLFKDNPALMCLAKSDMFFQDLSNIFSLLYQNNIMPLQFENIVKSIKTSETDNKRLLLISKLYAVYLSTMEENGFKIPVSLQNSSFFSKADNVDVQKRVEYLYNSFNGKIIPELVTEESNSIKYLEFSDIQNETLYIIDEIKKLVENGDASYSQIAVFIDKTEARKKFLDLVKSQNLPVISSIYSEDYENLKHKINLYQKISDVFLELNLQEFSYDEIKNINISSKAQKEISFEKLDDLFKTIVLETLKNPYNADKFFSNKENSQKSLLECIFALWNTLEEDDKNNLSQEFNSIKIFYEDYKNQNYAKAIETLIKKNLSKFENTQVKDAVLGKIKSLNELQNLFEKIDAALEFDSFKEIMQGLPKDKELEKNAIFLSSITTDTKKLKDIKYVYIAGLTQNNYPAANNAYPFISQQTNTELLKELQKISPDFDFFLKTDEIYFSQKLCALCSAMGVAKNKLTLTTHNYEAKKQAQPSVFFKLLTTADKINYKEINDVVSDSTVQTDLQAKTVAIESASKIIKENDTLKLNPSAINTFLKCPRKYYYKNLLNLKEPYTFSASYGSIVHAVFQVLNTRFKDKYNKNVALELADILFNSAIDEEKARQAGFSDIDIELVKAAPELSIEEMKNNFKDAVEDYDYSGGFDYPPTEAVCEKSFSFTLEKLPNVVFDGRIDAIITDSNGVTKVIDYKTGKDKTNSLDYAISDNGVNFRLKSGKEPSNIENVQKAYDYQIPLYYLAIQNSKELENYKDKVTDLGLVYIRPKAKDNGCNEDFVSAKQIETYKDKIIQNLKETVIDKIINETEFKPEKGWNCDTCAYNFLCDKEEE